MLGLRFLNVRKRKKGKEEGREEEGRKDGKAGRQADRSECWGTKNN